ncbi:MAG: hypothetical protein CMM15_03950 [Rhodospirillaceae bacterium]|nr:hypothetical protein [Rhodospirillaceae bacterium]
MSKETRKSLKESHDKIKEYLKRSRKVDEVLRLVPENIHVGVYESDFTEILDSSRSDMFEKSGDQKLTSDVYEATLASDGIAEHKKYSNTTKKLKYYMTKYYKTGCNPGFSGYIRLSQEFSCASNGCSLSYQVNRDLYIGQDTTHYDNFDFIEDILYVSDINEDHQGYTFTVHPPQQAFKRNEIKGIIVNMDAMIPNGCGNLPSIKVNYEPESSESCSLKEKENEDIEIPYDDQKPTKEGEDWKLQNNILSLSGNSMNYTGYTFTIIGYVGMPGIVVDMTELKANTCGNLPFVQINYVT